MTAGAKVGIVVGGGPAPGINAVIAGATREAHRRGRAVVGVLDGYKWLSRGDAAHVVELTPEAVERAATRGGSILRTSRANPTKDPEDLERCLGALRELGVTELVSIGGDDTAHTARVLSDGSDGALRVAHAPKTIDNDLPLPHGLPTFGYETARQEGARVVRHLVEDARTAHRWYLVVAMGRSAGHLALGMARGGGAHVAVLPEEFEASPSMDDVVDILEGAVLKRRAAGQAWGVAVVAEGVGALLDPDTLGVELPRDEHGHPRLSEVDLGRLFKGALESRLAERGRATRVVSKDVGYELRCADPVAFDVDYGRSLGQAAVEHLARGGESALVAVDRGAPFTIPFHELRDPETGRTRVRRVDVSSPAYRAAWEAMDRLKPQDLEDDATAGAIAREAGVSPAELRARFHRAAHTPKEEQAWT